MGTPIVPEDRAYSREEEIVLMNTMHAAVAELLNRK
jgi:hypothetical protein